jgi:hypothetical protein
MLDGFYCCWRVRFDDLSRRNTGRCRADNTTKRGGRSLTCDAAQNGATRRAT